MVHYRRLRRWADNGAESCIHMHQILHAETLSTSVKPDIDFVLIEYDRVVESAATLRFRQHVALANELARMYLNSIEPRKATPYLSRAAELYREWGAEAKVKDLHARFELRLSAAPPCRLSSSIF
jgi:hypothetical protein